MSKLGDIGMVAVVCIVVIALSTVGYVLKLQRVEEERDNLQVAYDALYAEHTNQAVKLQFGNTSTLFGNTALVNNGQMIVTNKGQIIINGVLLK